MAKTYRTDPYSKEPPRRSNRTAGKSPASVDLPARKPADARKTTGARNDYMEVRVKRINVPGKREEVVTLPKYPVNGSHFGTCTCGATQTDAVPCEHMSVVALSAIIRPQISPMNIMPVWWKRSQWRLQFPLETCPEAKITMKTVKEG
jgi:hypothetical protein